MVQIEIPKSRTGNISYRVEGQDYGVSQNLGFWYKHRNLNKGFIVLFKHDCGNSYYI